MKLSVVLEVKQQPLYLIRVECKLGLTLDGKLKLITFIFNQSGM